jgi:hypothetical protein
MNKQALSAHLGSKMNALGFSADFTGASMEAWKKQSANDDQRTRYGGEAALSADEQLPFYRRLVFCRWRDRGEALFD